MLLGIKKELSSLSSLITFIAIIYSETLLTFLCFWVFIFFLFFFFKRWHWYPGGCSATGKRGIKTSVWLNWPPLGYSVIFKHDNDSGLFFFLLLCVALGHTFNKKRTSTESQQDKQVWYLYSTHCSLLPSSLYKCFTLDIIHKSV